MTFDPVAHNRLAWDREVEEGNEWSRPVGPEVIAKARAGQWSIVLIGYEPVDPTWFPPDIAGRDVLCLASGGGQQGPVLAAAGARVTVFDNSPRQLAQDEMVAAREGLDLRTVLGDARDLSAFPDASFDLISTRSPTCSSRSRRRSGASATACCAPAGRCCPASSTRTSTSSMPSLWRRAASWWCAIACPTATSPTWSPPSGNGCGASTRRWSTATRSPSSSAVRSRRASPSPASPRRRTGIACRACNCRGRRDSRAAVADRPEPLPVLDALHSTPARRYLSTEPVPKEIIWALLDAAIRGPTGGNRQGWGWVVVTDPAIKQPVAEWYLAGWTPPTAAAGSRSWPRRPRRRAEPAVLPGRRAPGRAHRGRAGVDLPGAA